MTGLTVTWNERYEAALHAWGLVSCLPCRGSGFSHTWEPPPLMTEVLDSDQVSFSRPVLKKAPCTLCNGKGITHPPPESQ